MPKFRKKSAEFEAHQVPPEGSSCSEEMCEFLEASDREIESQWDGSILIHTPDGAKEARPGDWIIKGTFGEYFPCKPDVFADTYELSK